MTLPGLLLMIALASGDRLANYERIDIATGALYSWGWSRAEVERLGRSIPVALARVEERLDRRLRDRFTTVLTPDSPEFRRVVEELSGVRVADTVVGVAVPSARLLVIRGGPSVYADFEETLYHEIAHLIIHEGRSRPVPRWLDEGTAMWASRHRLTPSDEAYVALLARLGRLYTLESLADRFPAAHKSTSTAYLQSLLFIRFLVESHGDGIVPRLLERVSRDNAAEVLSELTAMPIDELERKFTEWVISRTSLLWPLSAVWNIWTAAALLAIVAIVRSRLRRRRVLRQMEEEEGDCGQQAAVSDHP
jgi:hypothetical protein